MSTNIVELLETIEKYKYRIQWNAIIKCDEVIKVYKSIHDGQNE